MVFRIQFVEGEYRIVLSAEAMEALGLKVGSMVEVVPVSGPAKGHTLEEGVAAYLRTEPLHENTYRALAKS